MYHADTTTHKINVFPYKTDGSVAEPILVKNYLVQIIATDYATNARRLVTAFSSFIPQYRRFISLVMFSFVLILSCIVYSGFISSLKIGLAFLFIVMCVPALPLQEIQECPDGSIIDSKD